MKLLSLLISTFLTVPAFAARDSLGVFYSSQKTLVVITQSGVQSRLRLWLKHLDAKQDVKLSTADQSFTMNCLRDVSLARCQFRLVPSNLVRFDGKKIEAHIPLQDLGLEGLGSYEVPFESSNGDRLDIVISDGVLHFYASKAR